MRDSRGTATWFVRLDGGGLKLEKKVKNGRKASIFRNQLTD